MTIVPPPPPVGVRIQYGLAMIFQRSGEAPEMPDHRPFHQKQSRNERKSVRRRSIPIAERCSCRFGVVQNRRLKSYSKIPGDPVTQRMSGPAIEQDHDIREDEEWVIHRRKSGTRLDARVPKKRRVEDQTLSSLWEGLSFQTISDRHYHSRLPEETRYKWRTEFYS